MKFIENLQNLVDESIFGYTFMGGQLVAFALLAFQFIGSVFRTNIDTENSFRKESYVMLLGGACLILSSNWIMDAIEEMFSGIDISLYSTESNIYNNLTDQLYQHISEMWDECDFWYEYISTFFEHLCILFYYGISLLIAFFAKLADLMTTASYLIQRYFILVFLKLLFPLCIAFSTYPKLDHIFFGWIKSYIGVFILGIGYIGIIKFCNLIPEAVISSFKEDQNTIGLTTIPFASIVAVVLTAGVKMALFKSVTDYVYSFFR